MKKGKWYKFYRILINCCFAVAILAAGSVSYWGGYQQKEPENILNLLHKNV